jgi:hypothetical protein
MRRATTRRRPARQPSPSPSTLLGRAKRDLRRAHDSIAALLRVLDHCTSLKDVAPAERKALAHLIRQAQRHLGVLVLLAMS